MPLSQYFDAIFLINLKRRPDRLSLSRFYLDRLGIKYTVFNAVDGNEHKPLYRRLKKQEMKGRLYGLTSAGALGLLKTWQRLLQQAKKRQYKRILILEDDIIPAKDFEKRVEEFGKMLKDPVVKNYKAMYLGSNKQTWKSEPGLKLPKGKNWFVPDTNLIYGTFAIALQDQNGFFDEILELIKGYKGGIDTYVLNSLRLQDLKKISNAKNNRGRKPRRGAGKKKIKDHWVVCHPNLFIADVSDSDNMMPRDFKTFAKSRRWDFAQYDRLPLQTFCRLRAKLNKKGINLRHILGGPQQRFSKKQILARLKTALEWCESQEKILRLFDTFLTSFIDLSLLKTSLINKYDLYRLFLSEGKPFVFIIPSYNNEKWIDKNLGSVLEQNYTNYRVIYLEDGSTDKTYQKTKKWLQQHPTMKGRTHLLRIPRNQGPAASRYVGYHLCDDDEIAVLLDGDDWLFKPDALNTLNQYYRDKRVFVTYGSFVVWNGEALTRLNNPIGVVPFKPKTITGRDYRSPKTPWRSVHLRTAYVRLLREIKIQNLWDSEGHFYRLSTDRAEMFPILEMAGKRHCNIPKTLCVYNKANSEAFATSYFRKEAENPWTQYRKQANKRISLAQKYSVRKWKTCDKIQGKPVKLPKFRLISESDNNDEIIIDLNLRENSIGSSLTTNHGICRLPNKAVMKKFFNCEFELSMNQESLIKTIESYSKVLVNYRGVEGLLFLLDPFEEETSNIVMPDHDSGTRCFGSGFELFGKSLGIIAGEVRFLKPEYRKKWMELPGLFLNGIGTSSPIKIKQNANTTGSEAPERDETRPSPDESFPEADETGPDGDEILSESEEDESSPEAPEEEESSPEEPEEEESLPEEPKEEGSLPEEPEEEEESLPEKPKKEESLPEEPKEEESLPEEPEEEESLPEKPKEEESLPEEPEEEESLPEEPNKDESLPEEPNKDESLPEEPNKDESLPEEPNKDETARKTEPKTLKEQGTKTSQVKVAKRNPDDHYVLLAFTRLPAL